MKVTLDSRGSFNVDVPNGTEPGMYTLVAVLQTDESRWVPVSRSIRVK